MSHSRFINLFSPFDKRESEDRTTHNHTTDEQTQKAGNITRVLRFFSFVRRLSSSPFPISVLSPRDGQTDRRRDDGSRSWGCKYRDGERGTEGGVEANEGGRHNCCCCPWWIHTTNEGGPDFTQRASERGSRGPKGGGNTGMEEGLAIHKDTGWRCSHVAGWFTQIHSPRARTVTPINTINANALSSKMSVAAAEITNAWEEQNEPVRLEKRQNEEMKRCHAVIL